MRIQKLELFGFKSFAHPTVLDFASGISAIVGPNGCGKSNIVDALRWVIGEQAPSRLRASEMEDVLFNGTRYPDGSPRRHPVGMAEVSLLLENDGPPAGPEPPEIWKSLASVPEILVTRRFFRSGESEYLINRRPCRLKDISELFLGTGVGTRAYSVVEQGQIDDIVKARPETLRLFVEEAAGTTLYRSRRLAAERRLERTREALGRVGDVLRGLDREIALLKRMSRRAEEYRRNQEELREVELRLARRRADGFGAEIGDLEGRREALKESMSTLADRIAALEQEQKRERERHGELDEDLQAQHQRVMAFRAARERDAATLGMLEREDLEELDRRSRREREREEIVERVRTLEREIEGNERELCDAVGRRAAREHELAREAGRLTEAEDELETLARELEQIKVDVIESLRRESSLRNDLGAAGTRIEEREQQLETSRREIEALESERRIAAAELESLDGRLAALGDRLRTGKSELVHAEETRRRLEDEAATLDRRHFRLTADLAEAESRREAAEEAHRAFARYEEGVRAVMQHRGGHENGVLNLVGEVLETDPEYERALAAVLGERLQQVVVRTPDDARRLVEELRASDLGRSAFVPAEPRAEAGAEISEPPNVRGTPLLEVVRVQEGYGALARHLLRGALVVRDLADGLAVWQSNGHRRTLVTRDGDVVFPDGAMSGGSGGVREERLLTQRRELRELTARCERLRLELGEIDTRRQKSGHELDECRRRAAAVEEAMAALGLDEFGCRKDAERARETVTRLAEEVGRRQGNTERVIRDLEDLRRSLMETRRRLEDEAATRSRLEEKRGSLESLLADRRPFVEGLRRETEGLRVSRAQAEEKEEGTRAALGASTSQRERDVLARARLDEEIAELDRRAEARRAQMTALRSSVDANGRGELEGTEAVEAVRRVAADVRERVERRAAEIDGLRAELESRRGEASTTEIRLTEARVERDHLVSTIREQYGVDPHEAAPGDEATSALESRFEDLRRKVERLGHGELTPGADGELERLETERQQLVGQKEDLERSVADLEKTIAILNRESRTRFADTFTAVDECFQKAFPHLFGGGRARLVLTDEHNLLETGVEVEAQPPGMAVRALSLLSGGQRSLTAVGLIFALLQYRPSPFCVLDEVDHALDDANIDRFRQILDQMSESSQFLVITHNKRTMESARNLYGVTMEEPGVSQVVSVRLQNAA